MSTLTKILCVFNLLISLANLPGAFLAGKHEDRVEYLLRSIWFLVMTIMLSQK